MKAVLFKVLLIFIRPNEKNKCVSGNRSENLGRVGTHIFFIFFSGEKYNFMHFERQNAF